MLLVYFTVSFFIVIIMSLAIGRYLKINQIFAPVSIYMFSITTLVLVLIFPYVYKDLSIISCIIWLISLCIILAISVTTVEAKIFNVSPIVSTQNQEKSIYPHRSVALQPTSNSAVYNNTEPSSLETCLSTLDPSQDVIDIEELIENISIEHAVDWDKIGVDTAYIDTPSEENENIIDFDINDILKKLPDK